MRIGCWIQFILPRNSDSILFPLFRVKRNFSSSSPCSLSTRSSPSSSKFLLMREGSRLKLSRCLLLGLNLARVAERERESKRLWPRLTAIRVTTDFFSPGLNQFGMNWTYFLRRLFTSVILQVSKWSCTIQLSNSGLVKRHLKTLNSFSILRPPKALSNHHYV